MVDTYCNASADEVSIGRNIPDHSALLLTFSMRSDLSGDETFARHDTFGPSPSIIDDSHFDRIDNRDIYYTRFTVKNIPNNFFDNEESARSLIEVISKIENIRHSQREVDSAYERFCEMYYTEMKKWLPCKNIHPSAKKRFHRRTKPFWSDELGNLWKILCEAEKCFTTCRTQSRQYY